MSPTAQERESMKQQQRALGRHLSTMRLGVHNPDTCEWCQRDSAEEAR